jgi:hypothetical protein
VPATALQSREITNLRPERENKQDLNNDYQGVSEIWKQKRRKKGY